jgi:hypothetical protein
MVYWIRRRQRRLVEGGFIIMLGGFVSAPARGTATATTAFAALISTTEAIEDAC